MKNGTTKEAKELMVDIRKTLTDPKLGIKKEAQKAIRKLFEYGLLGKPLDGAEKSYWEALGRIDEDGNVLVSAKNPEGDLCVMSLQYAGRILQTKIPV